ncbi:MAG TPA: S8 family peptidase [Oscillatoriaceae cyanobacterium M33_DOE_052]|nr:S8 family peptidase [Oscillatoriaceae cyanobacterium M33_DOE_052]
MPERQSIEYQVPLPIELGEPISSANLKMVVGDKPEAVSLWQQLHNINIPKFAHTSAPEEWVNWGQSMLGIPKQWWETRGEGVVVAVLDTGIDQEHPALTDAIVDYMDFTGEGKKDENGHGTHCGGIIVARDIGTGFTGVAPAAKLLVGKVLNKQGKGDAKAIAAGVNWAVEKGAHIISISFGARRSDNLLHKAIHTALAKGVFVICAAGNCGSRYQNSIDYPGRYGGVITVAAHDRDGQPMKFSSRGGEIDFIAPGESILSTYPGGQYHILSGTSMATPFVAGVAALIAAKHLQENDTQTPLENNEDLREHLMRMAAHPGNHDSATGYGALTALGDFYSGEFETLTTCDPSKCPPGCSCKLNPTTKICECIDSQGQPTGNVCRRTKQARKNLSKST